jgi:hypothetical protein
VKSVMVFLSHIFAGAPVHWFTGAPERVSPEHIIHWLCLGPPTPELVRRVSELYPKRVSDVRFLIPVLSGLSRVSFMQHQDYHI